MKASPRLVAVVGICWIDFVERAILLGVFFFFFFFEKPHSCGRRVEN